MHLLEQKLNPADLDAIQDPGWLTRMRRWRN